MALKLESVRALAERVATSHGLEVVDLEFAGSGKDRILRVFLEKDEAGRKRLREALERLQADGETSEAEPGKDAEWDREWLEALPSVANLEFLSGITHGDCEVFSRDFGTVLDVEDLVPGSEYLLEVSSPGLDRRLATERDFARFQGSLVKLETHAPLPGTPKGQRKWRGRIVGVDGGNVLLRPEEAREKGAKGRKKKSALDAGESEGDAPVAIPLSQVEKAHLVPEL
jgi:ribosome maturation factor RimP